MQVTECLSQPIIEVSSGVTLRDGEQCTIVGAVHRDPLAAQEIASFADARDGLLPVPHVDRQINRSHKSRYNK